jgi:phage tail-like protein
MTAETLRSYLFRTEAQWDACLFSEADRGAPGAGSGGLRPFAPYGSVPVRYPTSGALAPAIARGGDILWCDGSGSIYRLPADEDVARGFPAPFPTADLSRLVATSRGLWVLRGPPVSLQLYEEDSLARLLTVELQDTPPVDIAAADHGAVVALVREQDREVWKVVRIDCAGHIGDRPVTLAGLTQALRFVFLSRTRRFVVLTGEAHPRLRWFAADGRALFSLVVGAMHPCFTAGVIGSDGRDRVFVGGADGPKLGGTCVLIHDADGNRLGEVPLAAADAPMGLAGTRDTLVVTSGRGLLRFQAGAVVPDEAGEVRALLVTPKLYSPDREDGRRWLRIDVSATLPEGSSLELSAGATDDVQVRDRLTRIAGDVSLPASHRARMLLGEPDIWRAPTVFHGSGTSDASPVAFSAPLFDVGERYLWVSVTLVAAPGGRLPAVTELAVRYPGHSLMDELPAIYRRGEADSGDFLRTLVGVLETTSQGLDARIASLGSLVHPSTASSEWLDFVARWLGLPWDNALSFDQKKRIVERAAKLAGRRGTRAGLETLLDALMPGTPRQFRVIDTTADLGFAIVGGAAIEGSALPAMLGGLAPWTTELGGGAALGAMRLPCEGQVDDGISRLTGTIVVEVAATAAERGAWEPWLRALIADMVPLTTRVRLRWIGTRARRGNRLDGTLTLEAESAPHLGTDAVTGLARLPEGVTRLSASGTDIGSRLG